MSKKHRGRIEGEAIVRQLPTPAGGVKLETFVPWRLIQRGFKKEVITPLDSPNAFSQQAEEERRARAAAMDTPVMRALGLAHHWQRLLNEQRVASAAEIAEAEGIDTSQVHRLMRLTLLAPDVVEKMVDQPGLTVEKVFGRPWPYGWREQVRLFG